MSPVEIAAVAAAITTFSVSLFPVDRLANRQAKSWVKSEWWGYRLKLLGLQLLFTGFFALAATQVGWVPEDSTNAFLSATQGFAWAITAVALLRAEFPGFNGGEAVPGLSILRWASTQLTSELGDDIKNAVRGELPNGLDDLEQIAIICNARAHPPRSDGTQTPDALGVAAGITLLREAGVVANLREFVVNLVADQKLPKIW